MDLFYSGIIVSLLYLAVAWFDQQRIKQQEKKLREKYPQAKIVNF